MNSLPESNLRDALQALSSQALVIDLADRAQLELTGADRAKFLQNLCTNDILSLAPGEGCEAFFCNAQGKLVGYAFIFCRPHSLVVESAPHQAAPLFQHLDRYLIREEVEIHDRSHEWNEILLAGPQAAAVVQAVVQGDIPTDMLGSSECMLSNIRLQLRRTPFTIPTNFILSVARDQTADLLGVLESHNVSPGTSIAFEAARIQAGCPFYGLDISDTNLPQEIDRNTQAIHFQKGCYLGQETVARIDALGHVNQQLVGLSITSDHQLEPHTAIFSGEKQVGTIKSTATILDNRLIALGFVRREHASAGTLLSSPSANGTADVTVTDLPIA